MHKTYSRYIENNSSILIGITSDDMYPLGQDWRFCFGWRQTGIRSAVVSTARIDLTGLPPQVNSLSFHLVQKRPVRSRARDTRLSSTLEYALYYLRPPICHELSSDDDNKYGNAISNIFYLRHAVNTILFPSDMTPLTNKLIRHDVIHTNCCCGRLVMGHSKIVLLQLRYED
jgi:hypothetical protein